MNRLRLVDAAWLAAAIDGEGSICFKTDKRKQLQGRKFQWPYLTVTNTNRPFVDHFAELTKATISTYKTNRGWAGKNALPLHKASAYGRHLKQIVLAVMPYLIIKRQEAQKVLDYYESNPKSDRSTVHQNLWARMSWTEKDARLLPLRTGWQEWVDRLSPSEKHDHYVRAGQASAKARRGY